MVGRNVELVRTVRRLSAGLLGNLTSLIFYSLATGLAGVTTSGGKSSRTAGNVVAKADNIFEGLLSEFDPMQIYGALANLRRKGLIKSIRGKIYEAEITRRGLEEMSQELPIYREERLWDKRVYLVSYDIEEEEREVRNELREYLKEIKCVPIHQSLYLSIYNPRGLLKKWSRSYLRCGDVLISDLGPDGAIGERPLTEIVATAYNLTEINSSYDKYLQNFPKSANNTLKMRQRAYFHYNSILIRDPQLPFELLPDRWLGDRAWKRYQQIVFHN